MKMPLEDTCHIIISIELSNLFSNIFFSYFNESFAHHFNITSCKESISIRIKHSKVDWWKKYEIINNCYSLKFSLLSFAEIENNNNYYYCFSIYTQIDLHNTWFAEESQLILIDILKHKFMLDNNGFVQILHSLLRLNHSETPIGLL